MVKGIQIQDLQHLKMLLIDKTSLDCFVMLNGHLRSSKTIMVEGDGEIGIINEIDDSFESFKSLEAMTKEHDTIRKALEKGAFYVYGYELLERCPDMCANRDVCCEECFEYSHFIEKKIEE